MELPRYRAECHVPALIRRGVLTRGVGEFSRAMAACVQMPGGCVGGGDLVVAVLESLQEIGIGEQIVVAPGLVVFGAHPPG